MRRWALTRRILTTLRKPAESWQHLTIMLHWFKFHASVRDPEPARDILRKLPPGRGHPEECPPLRAANGFGFDVLTSFDMTFTRQKEGGWKLEQPVTLTADWAFAPVDHEPAEPQSQVNAWFWEQGQTVPHRITDDVFPLLRNQVKVSTWLYLTTDPGELLCITAIPNHWRPWRSFTALVDADRYDASYPWHCVLELDPRESQIHIPAGEPICRLYAVPRQDQVAREMSPDAFGDYFLRGQEWLAQARHGGDDELADITGRYAKLMQRVRCRVERA
jgi:hypothetical protein